MESTSKHELKVGLFTVAGVFLFCLSIILLGGDKMLFSRMYKLKVLLPQVQGLAKGSVVTLSGLQVGNVDDVRFIAGSNDVEVEMNIELKIKPRITEGSIAAVKTQGALGDKYIYITPGPTGGKPLEEGSTLETDKAPDIIDLISSKGSQMGEIVDVIKELHVLLRNLNSEDRSARLMSNLVDVSGEMKAVMAEARDTFRIMKSDTIQPLASVIKKIDRGDGTLGALINDPSLHNRLQSFLGDAPRNKFLKPLIRDSIQTHEQKN